MNTWYECITCPNCYIDKYGIMWCFEQIGDVKISTHRCDGKVYKECLDKYKADIEPQESEVSDAYSN